MVTIKAEKIAEQLCTFYSKEKLLKAYKLAYSLMPKSRKLRNTPDPNLWKEQLIAQHLINIISDFKKEKILVCIPALGCPTV